MGFRNRAAKFAVALTLLPWGPVLALDSAIGPCPQTVKMLRAAVDDLYPPRTEFNPRGRVDLSLTISKSGHVIDSAIAQWQVVPDEVWFRQWVLTESRKLMFEPVRESCVYIMHYRFKGVVDRVEESRGDATR
jgi:hypothetical protein